MAALRRSKRVGFMLFALILVVGGLSGLIKQPAVAQADPAFYCDFRNKPSGDVATWWRNAGVAPDCIDLAVVNSPSSCSLTATFTSYVFSNTDGEYKYRDLLYWFETDSNGVVLRPAGGGAPLNWGNSGPSGPGQGGGFTLSFPEDYNGGTAYVLINFASPENQIQPGLEQIDLNHWRTTSAGVLYPITTDCQLPPTPTPTPTPVTEVLWCSPGYWKNHPDSWNVALTTTYADVFGADPVNKKGKPVADATLFDVISQPQVFGGPMTEQVASYLSGLAGLSDTVPDGSLPVSCPLN